MDSNRSGEASYSDDFEHDMESQDSAGSEEKVEIKVYKSAVGPLTIQPKKMPKHTPRLTEDNNISARTLSELSLVQTKRNKPPATAACGRGLNKFGNKSNNDNVDMSTTSGRSLSLRVNPGSKTSLNTIGNRTVTLRRPLAHEKLDPHDIPASVAGSVSSVSLSRLHFGNRSATASGFPRGTPNNIRRVIAHTSIKEKSYASAKYKTYHNPQLLRGSNQPPLKAGLAKPNTNVAQRVASAKRMTIMDLKSKIKLLQDEIEKLKKENRFLNHLHHRQDNALRKWEGKDAELPRLLNQHKDEIRSLQEQLRRAQQSSREYSEKVSVRDKKIVRLENQLEKLKALVHEEHLQDRHTLQEDLDITRMNLVGAEKRIREYMRHVDILEKNHRHQLAAQERKLIKVNTHTYELQQVVANLKLALRNKDRMLNYIQMRSTGRTLIRAFHAERHDRGDDMLYGTSIQSDLTRPYQPPALPPLMKSHSFDFGNSRCTSPLLDGMKDYEIFSTSRHLSDENKANRYHKDSHNSEKDTHNTRNRSPSAMSNFSHSLESIVRKQQLSPKLKNKVNSSSVAACSIKSHGKKESDSKSATKMKGKQVAALIPNPNSLKTGSSPKSRSSKVVNIFSNNKNLKTAHGDAPGTERKVSNDKSERKSHSTNKSNQRGNQLKTRSPNRNPVVETTESKELIYHGSTQGFKYEGPFISDGSNVDNKKDSTEILYSAKSENLSERSLSSTCTSQTVTSSRSEEIISNIDILSARIKESCVLVPPPEEAYKSPRDLGQEAEAKVKNTLQLNNKPTVGPAGDNMHLSQQHSNPAAYNEQPLSPSFPNAILQPVQMLTEQDGISHQSFVSPRVQLHSLSLPSPQAAQGQFQIAHTNYVTQVADQALCSPTTQVVAANASQMIDSNAVQFVSPRITHGYAPMQNVAILPETQHEITVQQGQHIASSRLAPQYPYFSYASNSEIQERLSPNNNVSIFQTNPAYTFQQGFLSPRNSMNSEPTHSPPAIMVSPSTRGAFSRMSLINSSQVNNTGNSAEQTLPVLNNNVKSQSSYNPSYYVNLGSWK